MPVPMPCRATALHVYSANIAKGASQRVDMEIVDGSNHRNTYQKKTNINGETRMAITTHADADLGVCFKNHLDNGGDPPSLERQAGKKRRTRAMLTPLSYALNRNLRTAKASASSDRCAPSTWTSTLAQMPLTTTPSQKRVRPPRLCYRALLGRDPADQLACVRATESLSGLEVEMRKLEGVVKEIVDELNYLKRREARMRDTNESTNERVWWFSILTISTLVSLGIWQIIYLRQYFRRKHLID